MARKRIHNCNDRFFQTIDSEAKAYWLGFIYADGYVVDSGSYLLGICLAESDRGHLEAFKTAIEATNPIISREDVVQFKQYNHKTTLKNAKIRINSRELVYDLKRLGVVPRKSKTLTFPDPTQVPIHLRHHFVRGYFDGDGSIWYSQQGKYKKWGLNIISTQAFCERLLGVFGFELNRFDFAFVPHPTTVGMTYLQCSSLKGISAIRDFLYRDASIWLDRKRMKFGELPEKVEAEREVCRRNIPPILSMAEDCLDSKQIYERLLPKIPGLRWGTVQLMLRELAEQGRIDVVGHYGRTLFYSSDGPAIQYEDRE